MRVGAMTDIGKVRKQNEDNYFVCDQETQAYAMVADGMGGHQAGEVASDIAVDVVRNHIENRFPEVQDYGEAAEVIRQGFLSANKMIYSYAKQHYKVMGMGTTATLMMVYQGKLITTHVGDSRGYYIHGGMIEQITHDHSYVYELVRRGLLTPEQAKTHPKRNYITRAMGTESSVKVDVSIRDYEGGIVLVCTDGLTNHVEDGELLELLTRPEPLQENIRRLIELAKERGGDDNITAAAFELD